MGPRGGQENGWGRRIRTPATWSRATRPTTRRSPTSAPAAHSAYGPPRAQSTNGGLQRAARAEAGHPRRRDRDLLARARIPAVPGGAAGDDERPESADG